MAWSVSAVSVEVPPRGSRRAPRLRGREDAQFGRSNRNKRLDRARAPTTRTARRFHQVTRRRRSRSPDKHVTRREGVHRGTTCLAMLRGAMTALAPPPPSPPKRPPLLPHPPTLVPSDTPCYSHTLHLSPAPADTADSTAMAHPSLPLA
ncbi:hypothetical protein PUN28_018479 [Cardiocondyla obscurior]|uniref:Uncharacterized protein n=1 Tax=Cardiocondyla obscurior TaxID=286306 RepID=A0AAW2EJF4_9HYME